jgi:NitT/TauT family transport system substrate-binding protein
VRTLESAGLKESDVIVVNVPADQMASAVVNGQADAISMWEPEAQNTVEALGRDAVVFQDNRLYRELFSLYSTTDVMSDPRRRSELVGFVRALVTASAAVTARPREYFPLVARVVKQPIDRVAKSWEYHRFPAAMPADMLEVMVREEEWLARRAPAPSSCRSSTRASSRKLAGDEKQRYPTLGRAARRERLLDSRPLSGAPAFRVSQ